MRCGAVAERPDFGSVPETQTLGDWIASHVRAFDFMEGVSEVLVCDQLKSGVSKPCRYEPGVHRTYQEMAEFYGTTVIPARPRKPRDKAKVEAAVLVAERWILARLRHQTFFSLAELNARIRELLVELNSREMRAYGASRRELFESLDRPVLRALPRRRFTYGVWSQPKVNIDYHVEVDRHFYSVPHALVHEMVDARTSASVVEIFHRGKRVACHARSPVRGGFTSCAEHMPKSHRKHLEWTPSRLIRWAGRIGPQTQALVTAILEDRPHPEQGYRSCLGIMRLAKRHGAERLEAACARALAADARSYRHVDRILKNGLDRVPLPTLRTVPTRPRSHANLRGARYYGDAKGGSSC